MSNSKVILLVLVVLTVAYALPRPRPQTIAENRVKAAAAPPARVPFQLGPSFDEIVVESSLQVKGKPAGANRNGRTKLMLVTSKPTEVPIEASG